MSEKTEQPTARRLRRARLEGDSPVSAALTQALVFIVGLLLVPATLAATAKRATELVLDATSGAASSASAERLVADVLILSLPLVCASALAALAVGTVQTGAVVSTKKLRFDLSRLNPLVGLRNLVRLGRLSALLRSLVGAALVTWLCVVLVRSELPSLAAGVGRLGPTSELGLRLAHKLAWLAALVGLALGVLDVFTTRHSWLGRLKMSRDEIRREHREAEGDPELKRARQRAHREMLVGSALNAVKEATVVIVNPTHLATALKYDDEVDQAPRVVSQGAGDLARKIVEAAHAYGVPVVRDVPVAQALRELEIGDEIPEELYEAVAEVLREVLEHDSARET